MRKSNSIYITQSHFTTPGKYEYLYQDLPDSLIEICNIVNGLVVHQNDVLKFYGSEAYNARKLESQARYVEVILGIINNRNPLTLTSIRNLNERYMGTCRDYAILLCSILRFKGVPARIRCGFASYFHDSWYSDHWVCEYLDKLKNKWILVDAELGEEAVQRYKIDFNPTNLPDDKFLVAGEAWIKGKKNELNPEIFGVYNLPDVNGLSFIRANVFKDLAALNKIELLPWDYTEYYEIDDLLNLSIEDLRIVGKVAKVTSNKLSTYHDFNKIYLNNKNLHIGKVIISHTNWGTKKVML